MLGLKEINEFLTILGVSYDNISLDFFRIEEMNWLATDIHKKIREVDPIADRIGSEIEHLQSSKKS